MKLVLAVFVALAAVAAADVQFTVCGSQPQVMTVSTLSVQPFPAVPGQNVNVTLIGSGSSSLTAGKYAIQADYMGITILTQTGDVCTLDPSHPCPMTAGPIAISHVLPVPSIAPAGQYDISISSTDQNGNTVVCLNFALTIGSGKAALDDSNDDAALDFEILEPSIAMPEQDAADLPSTDMPAPEQPAQEQEQDEQPVQEEEEEEEQQQPEPEQEEEDDGLIEEDQPEEPIAEEEQPEEEQEPEQEEEEEDGLIEEDLPNNAAPEDDDSIPMEDGEEAEEPAGDDEEESDQQPVAEDSDEGEVPPAEEDDEDQDEDDEQEGKFAPKNNEWKSCGDASYTFTVTSITTPDGAPVPGKQFTILVEGELSSEITGGTVTLKAEYDGIPVSSDTSNFCDAVANSTACPWLVGKQSLRSVSVIPDTTPSGDYVETLTAVDQNNKNVMCITGSFSI